MPGLRPVEVIILSLLGPAALFLLFWLYPAGRFESEPEGGDSGVTMTKWESRTRPIRVYRGDLPGFGPVRIFAGLTPGLDKPLPRRETTRVVGCDKAYFLYTLVMLNRETGPVQTLGADWTMRQGENRSWQMLVKPAGLTPRDRLLTNLFSPINAPLKTGKIARHLFSGREKAGSEDIVLSGPGGEVTLKAETMPAQDVLPFRERERGR